jgi:Fic family protein
MGRARGNYVTQDYPGLGGAQTAAQRRPSRFKAFIPASIADLELSLPSGLAAEMEAASTAVRTLNDSPPRLASLEGVARHLLRQESTASSRIEGLSLGHRRIALADFDLEGSSDQKAADIVGNIRAMVQALELGDSGEVITPKHIQGIHRTLLRFGGDEPIAGKWRTSQGWIGGSAPTTATYVPPPHTEVVRLMDDLCAFINRTDVPVLMQAAVAHAQFENVHPFADGNGRVGRCLIHTVLRRRGLAPRFVPPVSVVIAGRRDAYFAGLGEYRDADEIDSWLAFFADATAAAAHKADALSLRIDELEQTWLAAFEPRPRANSTVRRVIGMLPAHPVLNVPIVQTELQVSDVAAGNALNELTKTGVIRPVNEKVRGRVWECPTMYELMTEFEQSLV